MLNYEEVANMHAPRTLLTLLLVCLLAGCASLGPPRPPPPSLDEIVNMSQAGTPAEEIIRIVEASRGVYPLTAAELVKLHDRGVPDSVLDYLQRTYLAEVRRDEAYRAYHYYGWYYPFGPYYYRWGPRHYWGWGW